MNETARKRRIVDILGEALELPDPQRRSFLDQACAGDSELREELEELLAEETELSEDFLEVPAAETLRTPTVSFPETDAEAPELPDRLGPYRIVGELGSGGMGTVYLAEQEAPVRRRVALKVVDDTIHHAGRRERFKAECLALARLSHPNIASLYEAGATDDGHPFVAMELVEGTEITTWCDEHRLGLRQRIELFSGACAGIRHAHEKGILHRDLKPSNLLVTEIDGKPTAKVIDFGVARAFDEPLLSQTITLDHHIVGSPAYLSPEAAAFGKRDMDTRSDVYSLGLVLYELLVGVMPFNVEHETLASLLGRLGQKDWPAPGLRYGRLTQERREAIARRRKLSAEGLAHRLRGDLDAIVTKAIARRSDERYSSPADLAADLGRHLKNQPIEARPPSAGYLLGRFLRRHASAAVLTLLLILALTAGIVARTFEAQRANLEAERARLAAERASHEAQKARQALVEAQQVSRFLVDLFEISDPERNPGEPVDLRELLDNAAERMRAELADQPLARARFAQTIGEIYTKMALFDPAESLLIEAREIREAELPDDHPDVLASLNRLGVLYRRRERYDEAEPLLRRVLETREAAADPEPLEIALALNNLANLRWNQDRLDEAEALHRRALDIREKELGSDHQDVAETLNNLGALLQSHDRLKEAESLFRRAEAIFADTLGADHVRRGASLLNLAMVEEALGHSEKAERHYRRAAEIWEAAYGADHPRTLGAFSRLASLWNTVGHEAESLQLLRRLVRVYEASDLMVASTLGRLMTRVGIALGNLGDFGPAAEAFRRALEIHRVADGEGHPATINAHSNLAWLDWRRGRLVEAEAAHRRVLEIRKRLYDPDHPRIAWTLHHLALAIADQGRLAQAEPLLRRALEIRRATRAAGHLEIGESLLELGLLSRRAGRLEEARPLLERALEIHRRNLPHDHREVLRAAEALAHFDSVSEPDPTSPENPSAAGPAETPEP